MQVFLYFRYDIAPFDVNSGHIPEGRYVVFKKQHFQGFRVFADGSCVLHDSCKTHEGRCMASVSAPSSLLLAYEEVYRLLPRDSGAPATARPCDTLGGKQCSLTAQDFLEHLRTVTFAGPFMDAAFVGRRVNQAALNP